MPITYRKSNPPLNDEPEGHSHNFWSWIRGLCEDFVRPRDVLDLSYGVHPSPPISRVSPDILGEIFAHYLRGDPSTRPNHRSLSPISYADPQTLGAVCRSWRYVIHRSPSLWTTICVTNPHPRHVPKVAFWLRMSAELDLTLRITQAGSLDPAEHAATDAILSLMLDHVSRWRCITFLFSGEVHRPLLGFPPRAAQRLESAHICTESWGLFHADRLWRILHLSPSLRHVNWGRSYKALPVHGLWNRLTRIDLEFDLTIDTLLDLLQKCNNLAEVYVHSFLDRPGVRSLRGHPGLRLPALQTLSINRTDDIAPLLNLLTLPALSFLRLPNLTCAHQHSRSPSSHPPPTYEEQIKYLYNFAARSSFRLKTFILSGPCVSDDLLLSCLQIPQMQSLVHLELQTRVSSQLIDAMTPKPMSGGRDLGCLLPRLETIRFTRLSGASNGLMSEMILSRRSSDPYAPVAFLRSVHIHLNGSKCQNDLAEFRALGENQDWFDVCVW